MVLHWPQYAVLLITIITFLSMLKKAIDKHDGADFILSVVIVFGYQIILYCGGFYTGGQ